MEKILKSQPLPKLPVFSLVVAVPLSKQKVRQLASLIKREFSPRAVLEIKIDPTLIGGATIAWQGYYKDYSLRKKLNEKLSLLS